MNLDFTNYPPCGSSKRPRIESPPLINKVLNYPRFFIIKRTDEESFSKISPFIIYKSLSAYFGTLKETRKLSDGNILIEVNNQKQSEMAINFDKLFNYGVSTTPHLSLNIIKGLVTCKELLLCSDEEIVSELHQQGVVGVYRLLSKNDKTPTGTFIMSFNLHSLPKILYAGYIPLRVRVYIPNPLRCFTCNKFGHSAAKCKNPPSCPSCGHEPHEGSECNPLKICPNCSESHSPRYRGCSSFKNEFEIQKIRVKDNISYFEAKKKFRDLYPTFAKSYSSTAANSATSSKTPIKVKTSNASTQCNFLDNTPSSHKKTSSSSTSFSLSKPPREPTPLPSQKPSKSQSQSLHPSSPPSPTPPNTTHSSTDPHPATSKAPPAQRPNQSHSTVLVTHTPLNRPKISTTLISLKSGSSSRPSSRNSSKHSSRESLEKMDIDAQQQANRPDPKPKKKPN